jgi:uncharacterized protein (DUF1501 family)
VADPATLGVVFTGTVGVLGACTAATGHFVTLRNEEAKRNEARRDDLRGVVDDAARAMMKFEHPTTPTTTVGELRAILEGVEAEAGIHLGRVGVRVGPTSALYVRYEQGVASIHELLAAAAALPADVPYEDAESWMHDPAAAKRFLDALETVRAARHLFLREAAELVGAL